MKQNVRYRVLTIPTKLRVEIAIQIDERKQAEFTSRTEGGQNTSVQFYPYISLGIIRASEVDENGVRQRVPWDPNDNLSMTKYNFPIFLEELKGIRNDMKIPELYSYQGNRLELNEELSNKIRRVFMIGNTTLELSPVVVVNANDDTRVEGIKVKFNNEKYSFVLTLNELTSLVYGLSHMDIDLVCMWMYSTYCKSGTKPKFLDNNSSMAFPPPVDILPKA